MKNISLEEKLVLGFVLSLGILGIILYFYPTQFFMIYDKILFFMIQ
jgi:uncharacterized membrane protein YbaN (DUF454 family)